MAKGQPEDRLHVDDRLTEPISSAARRLGVSSATVCRMIDAGQLRSVHIRGRHLVVRASVEDLVAAS